MPVYFPGNGLPAGVKPIGVRVSGGEHGDDLDGGARLTDGTQRMRLTAAKRYGKVVSVFGSATGLAFSTAANAVTTKPVLTGSCLLRPEATGGLRVTTSVGAYAEVRQALSPTVVMPRTVAVELECDDWTTLQSVSLYLGDDAAYTNGYQIPLMNLSTDRPRTWVASMKKRRVFYAKIDEHTVFGAPVIGTTQVAHQKLRITPKAGVAASVTPKAIAYDVGAPRASISIISDDGAFNWYDRALPILETHGLPSALAFIGRSYDSDPANWMTRAQWQDALARGHEAVVHGCQAPVSNLSDLATEDAVLADLLESRRIMVEADLARNGSELIYVLPQGIRQHAFNDFKIRNALQRAGFRAVRNTWSGENNLFLPWIDALNGDAYEWGIIGHAYNAADEAANIAAIEAKIDQMVATGMSGTLMYHLTSTGTPTNAITISEANLARVSAYIAGYRNRGLLDVLLPSQQFAEVLDYGYL